MYYDDLSADDRDDSDSSSSCSSGDDNDDPDEYPHQDNDNTGHRIILHADVDCFYCQCEALDRGIDPDRPFAITQKHIIVTCNYVARQQYGLSKLESIQEAQRKCPGLLLIDGSDLRRYRLHARRIYESFRKALKEQDDEEEMAVCKGSMDEMMADLTKQAARLVQQTDADSIHCKSSSSMNEGIFIYGETSSTIILTEDQTGAETKVFTAAGRKQRPHMIHNESRKQETLLRATAKWAVSVRKRILQETGFTLTFGVSTNPLLAKLASGLRKPATVNLLYPERGARELVAGMPLTKLPGIGYRTSQALERCLKEAHGEKTDAWTCGDLLGVPSQEIGRCLEGVDSFQKSSREHGLVILHMCRGQDDSVIVDDQGGLPKTVSVENSFRRGTVCSMSKLQEALEELYHRLPILYQHRADWSENPEKSYPSYFRVTVRFVDVTLVGKRRRPFVTRSKQIPLLNGSELLQKVTGGKFVQLLRELTIPLLRSLLPKNEQINVTRVNIALAGFPDAHCIPSVQRVPLHASSAITTKTTLVQNKKKRPNRIDDFFPPRKALRP